jgi:hypothetical protein
MRKRSLHRACAAAAPRAAGGPEQAVQLALHRWLHCYCSSPPDTQLRCSQVRGLHKAHACKRDLVL